MKKRIVTEVKKWVDGSGYKYAETIQDEIAEIASVETCDFSFWDPEELPEGEDLEICVSYYDTDDEELEKPLATFSKWNSEF